MQKKIEIVLLTQILILFLLSFSAYGAERSFVTSVSVTYRDIRIFVNGKLIDGEEAFILNGKNIVMVPARIVGEATGKSVAWDGEKNIIRISPIIDPERIQKQTVHENQPLGVRSKILQVTYRSIQIVTGSRKISGEEPFVLNNKGLVMVPLRTIVEATGEPVTWDGKNNAVYVGTVPTKDIVDKGNKSINTQQTPKIKVDLEEMTVLRNVGPFFRQKKPFTIATEKYGKGVGVRLTKGAAEMVVRTHGKYKTIEGWLGVDDETCNTSGAFFFSVFTEPKEVPSIVDTEGGAEKIINRAPKEYDYDYNLVDIENEQDGDRDGLVDNIYQTEYSVNANLYEKTPAYLRGPIYPASYPKYISPGLIDISDALTVTIRVTWVGGEQGDYPDLTAVLADFKFIQ
ncbi:MAG: stalk domain-containing protein [Bacillota bacterium]|jgi:hypothetical protein